MCIAIVKPQGTVISDEYLENCFENNSDGAGIAYSKDGRLHIIKGIFNKKKFIECVRKVELMAQGDVLIHCRIGTSGLNDKDNCHPHIVNNSTVLIHNGILDIDIPKKSKVSDTIIFIKNYLKNLPDNFIKNKSIIRLIELSIGANNKFAFLNNKGEAIICNKNQGIVEAGIWYSNESFRYNKTSFNRDFLVNDYFACEYFEEYIDELSIEDYEYLGECPLINLDSWLLEAFSEKKYKDLDSYVSLKNFSSYLYEIYMDNYKKNQQLRLKIA